MSAIETANTLLAQYEEEAASLETTGVIAALKDLQFHACQVGEDDYAVVTVSLTEKGLRSFYALVKLEGDITIYHSERRKEKAT